MSERKEGLQRLSSHVPGLDTVLNGGFFRGGLYLIQGTPGSGKTTMANQVCFGHVSADRHRAVYVTLLAEYHARMAQYIGRMSFYDESKIPDQLSYISGFTVMREEGLDGLLNLLRREVTGKKATLLIVDGLLAAQRIADDDQAFKVFVHELQGIAIATDCTMLLITSAERTARTTAEHTMVDGILELSDHSSGWSVERTLHVSKIRGSGYLTGKHVYKITDAGLRVYPRTEALLTDPGIADRGVGKRISTGMAQFDAMLGGGIPGGSPTMLLGPSGIGKTTFGLHYLCGCSEAERGLMVGFYETPARVLAKARHVCEPLVALFESGDVELLWQPPTNDSLDAYAERLLSAVRRGGIERLFLDGLGALQNAPDAEERMRRFLPALMNELRVQGVTTIYSLEATSVIGPSIETTFGDLTVLADNIVLLRYVESGPRLHRLMSILKVRDSDFDPFMHEFTLTERGPIISVSTQTAQDILSGAASEDRAPGRQLRAD